MRIIVRQPEHNWDAEEFFLSIFLLFFKIIIVCRSIAHQHIGRILRQIYSICLECDWVSSVYCEEKATF